MVVLDRRYMGVSPFVGFSVVRGGISIMDCQQFLLTCRVYNFSSVGEAFLMNHRRWGPGKASCVALDVLRWDGLCCLTFPWQRIQRAV